MTLPHERIRALDQARVFLFALLDPKQTPKVPRSVRQWARRVVKHYPLGLELGMLARGDARLFRRPDFREQPLPPISRRRDDAH